MQSFVLDLKEPLAQAPQLNGYTVVSCEQARLDIEVTDGQSMNDLFRQLAEQQIEVVSLRNKSNRLEEFFLRLVGNKEKEVAA